MSRPESASTESGTVPLGAECAGKTRPPQFGLYSLFRITTICACTLAFVKWAGIGDTIDLLALLSFIVVFPAVALIVAIGYWKVLSAIVDFIMRPLLLR